RQAFDEGRVFESREYGKFIDQLVAISQLRRSENEIIQQSLELSRQLVEKLNSRGHGVNIGDIIIHRETTLNQRIKSRSTDPLAATPDHRVFAEAMVGVLNGNEYDWAYNAKYGGAVEGTAHKNADKQSFQDWIQDYDQQADRLVGLPPGSDINDPGVRQTLED